MKHDANEMIVKWIGFSKFSLIFFVHIFSFHSFQIQVWCIFARVDVDFGLFCLDYKAFLIIGINKVQFQWWLIWWWHTYTLTWIPILLQASFCFCFSFLSVFRVCCFCLLLWFLCSMWYVRVCVCLCMWYVGVYVLEIIIQPFWKIKFTRFW